MNTTASTSTATSTTLTGRRIGTYKVTLTNAAGDTLVAYTTLRAKPCRTVAHTYRCGGAATPIQQAGGIGLSSLAPGDTIRTGDFDVVVTEVLAGSNGVWTGIGYTEIPYLKGTRIAVEFKNARVNDCYEYTGGGTVQSAYDPSWGGIANVNNPLDQTRNALQQLTDLLSNYKASDKASLQQLSSQLNSYAQLINSDTTLTSAQKQQLIGAINTTKESVDCFISSSGGRRSAGNTSCTLEEVQQAANVGNALAIGTDDANCPCKSPKLTGDEKEGDEFVCSAETFKIFSTSQAAPTKITCFKKYVYFAGYPGSSYTKNWYYHGDYKNIAKFIENKVAPVIFIHGTFSSDHDAFTTGFKGDVLKALGSWTSKSGYTSMEWSGGNYSSTREKSADDIARYLNSDLGRKILKSFNSAFHVTLITHSHGGNVAKLIKRKLESIGPDWIVDLINIETPQRMDIQLTSSDRGVYLNFWSDQDLIQWVGSMFDFDLTPSTWGPNGPRRDLKASKNVELQNRPQLSVNLDARNMYRYLIEQSGGHGLQGDLWYQAQIVYSIQQYRSNFTR